MKLHDLYLKGYRMREVLIKAATVAICFSMGLHDLNAEEKMSLKLTSPAFVHGEGIPSKHTCEGADISPPLKWEGLPHNARSLVLIVDDPDAPDPKAPKMTWVHWVLYNIPPDTTGLPEGVKTDKLPAGTGEGLNNWKRTGYGGPCPPIGRHRYFHKLYALDMVLSNIERPTKSQIETAMKGHIIAETELVGTYVKSK
jgi:Raf kinase inhibitor-like YbhB/YbcL family protein